MSLSLLPDWALILRRSWTVRLSVISAGLSAAEFALPYVAPAKSSGTFALLALLVSVSAALARVVAQPKLWQALTGRKLGESGFGDGKA